MIERRTAEDLERLELANLLCQRYADSSDAVSVVSRVVREEFPGKIALVSSFGTESAVLLHLVSRVDRTLPIIFLDTLKHFEETLAYRDLLKDRLGLTNIRSLTPRPASLEADDPDGTLYQRNPDLCCFVRKTLPMVGALGPYRCWITGRKRFQGATRSELPLFDVQDRWVKFNPLAGWNKERLDRYFAEHDLPRHPLERLGYLSIGCTVCTAPVMNGSDDYRSGRWAGSDKVECGIHISADGTIKRLGRGD